MRLSELYNNTYIYNPKHTPDIIYKCYQKIDKVIVVYTITIFEQYLR